MLLEAIVTGRLPSPGPYSNISFDHIETPRAINYESGSVAHFTTTGNALSLFEPYPLISAQDFSPSQILPELNSLHSIQNSLDTAMDTADLRQIMRAALQTTSDAEMLEVLEVSRQEMPDAIKTLQRALERVTEGDDEVDSSVRRDTLDKEFIESGIDCLRRMSRGIETSLPSWTITK